MTWQKIGPILILSYSVFHNFYLFIIRISIILGSLGGLNQISIRKILAFSSINHIGWILAALIFNEIIWNFYFIVYTLINFSLIFLFNNFKIFYINQLFSLFITSYLIKFIFIINFLSLGGLPPFLGFIPKWIVIQSLSSLNQFILIFIIITITLITLYFYLRISFSAFILNYENILWQFKLNINFLLLRIISFITFISITSLFIIAPLSFYLI